LHPYNDKIVFSRFQSPKRFKTLPGNPEQRLFLLDWRDCMPPSLLMPEVDLLQLQRRMWRLPHCYLHHSFVYQWP